MEPAMLADIQLTHSTLTYSGDGADIQAFSCHCGGSSPLPGIALLHEMYGVTSHIKQTCLRLAAEGYAVLAPDLFTRGNGWIGRPTAMLGW